MDIAFEMVLCHLHSIDGSYYHAHNQVETIRSFALLNSSIQSLHKIVCTCLLLNLLPCNHLASSQIPVILVLGMCCLSHYCRLLCFLCIYSSPSVSKGFHYVLINSCLNIFFCTTHVILLNIFPSDFKCSNYAATV